MTLPSTHPAAPDDVMAALRAADAAIHTVAVPPTGLAVVRNLDPGSRVLAENLERICAELLAVGYDAIADRKREALNVCAGDWERVRALLDAPPARLRRG
jgi:hypothetical protein